MTNNDKPSASFSETLHKETGIRKDTLNDLGWLCFLRLCLFYEANIKLLQRLDGNGIWHQLNENVNPHEKKKIFCKKHLAVRYSQYNCKIKPILPN